MIKNKQIINFKNRIINFKNQIINFKNQIIENRAKKKQQEELEKQALIQSFKALKEKKIRDQNIYYQQERNTADSQRVIFQNT